MYIMITLGTLDVYNDYFRDIRYI